MRRNGPPPDLRQKPDTLAEALASLERGLAEYFKREGIDREE